jgi:hypothetical protein
MSIYPSVLAGYQALLDYRKGMPARLRLRDPRVPPVRPRDPLGVMASFPPAYSVEVVPLPEGINVCRFGKFGFGEQFQMVDHPVPHDDPSFAARLIEAIGPVVEEFLAAAEAHEKAERAANPTGPHESYEAIREVR